MRWEGESQGAGPVVVENLMAADYESEYTSGSPNN